MSRTNRPPLSLSKLAKFMKGKVSACLVCPLLQSQYPTCLAPSDMAASTGAASESWRTQLEQSDLPPCVSTQTAARQE